LATIAEVQRLVRKIRNIRSNRTGKIGNSARKSRKEENATAESGITSFSGQEEAEKSSAMMRTKRKSGKKTESHLISSQEQGN
jgi:hypothetical protein